MTATESTIIAAAVATARTREHIAQALALLAELDSARVNALGVYMEPLRQRTGLTAAREAIDAALAAMSSAEWPTPADYGEPIDTP